MKQHFAQLDLQTHGQRLYEFTRDAQAIVRASGITSGIMTLFCKHTSCSLTIQENADPDVQADLLAFFQRLVPENLPYFSHTLEGPDDMPAHVKSALTQTSLSIPVFDENLTLGTWQGVYLFEHRARPHLRQVVAHVIGEGL